MGKPIIEDRTEFGERMVRARKHARLTQPEAAKAAGIAQSTISELEKTGQGSSKTTTLAAVYGVRAEWLERGVGPMVDPDTEVPTSANQVASEKVTHYLVGTPAGTDYRTIALTLAAALAESGTDVTVAQFIKLLEATYSKLQR